MQEAATHSHSPVLRHPAQDNQRIFRAILMTMSRPGTITVLGNWPQSPKNLHPATAAVCLALVDMDTPLWIGRNPSEELVSYLRFQCGTTIVTEPREASFAVILNGNDLPDLSAFHPSDPEYPDRSATLIIQVRSIELGHGVGLTGPGIEDRTRLQVGGLRPEFWPAFQANAASFPLGYDVILCAGTEIVSLPRTVQVEV